MVRPVSSLAGFVRDVAEAERIALRILSENDILPVRVELLEPSVENLFLEAVQ